MDTSVTGIVFDSQGFCSYCTTYLAKYSSRFEEAESLIAKQKAFHEKVKRNGKGKSYDCIVGISGGVDSSYALYLAVKNGLRPLAVHLDNGWDSEVAQHNIANLVRRLEVDLYTHVIDWPENRDMQRALFKSGVIDIEIIMDNAQAATNYRQAAKYGLENILSGTNTRTEGIPVPASWAHYKFDARNIRAIHRKYGTMSMRTHPLISTLEWLYYEHVRRIHWHNYLDYFVYDKALAIETLTREFGYVSYQYKHGESIFTRFYQNYILPIKFGVDKRLVHHSTLICSGQMTRQEALSDLADSKYIDSEDSISDRKYVLKKLGFSEEEFNKYMSRAPVAHEFYPSELPMFKILKTFGKFISK